MLSSVYLTSTKTLAIIIGNFTVYVDDPSDNIASKLAYLNNNGRCLRHGSASHGKLLTITLYRILGSTAFANTEETSYQWDMDSLSSPFPNLSASTLPSSSSFKE